MYSLLGIELPQPPIILPHTNSCTILGLSKKGNYNKTVLLRIEKNRQFQDDPGQNEFDPSNKQL